MTRDRDDMLVDACLRGDRSAFDELVERYEGPLYNAAYRITGSVEDAMDATQSAFAKAYEKLHTYDRAHRFFSWIYRITLNQALSLVSRRRPQSTLVDDTPGTTVDPEAVSSKAEASRHLQRALMELEPDRRALVVLKHLEGFSYREISELLDIPERTVKSRLFIARRRLRAILVERGFVP